MQTFVKNADGTLQETNTPILKLYNKAIDIENDIANLSIGQLVGNIQSTVPTESFDQFLDYLQRIIPAGTSEGNMLVNQSQLPDNQGDFESLQNQINDLKDELANYATKAEVNQLSSRVGVNETNIANLSDSVTNVETSIADLESCPGINCVGTVVADDIKDFTTCVGTVTALYDCNCNIMHCPNTAGIICASFGVDMEEVDRIHCEMMSAVCDIANCPGLACTGTVRAVCYLSDGNCYNPDLNGLISIPASAVGGICAVISGNVHELRFSNMPVNANGVSCVCPLYTLRGQG